MTKYGNKIPDITKEQVREQLVDETDPKAIKRLTVAREYLEGLSPKGSKPNSVGPNRRFTGG